MVELPGTLTARNAYSSYASERRATTRAAEMKWKHKILIGLETLTKYVKEHPQAEAAFDELSQQVRHPFDPTESD
jgi:hypothetical protein